MPCTVHMPPEEGSFNKLNTRITSQKKNNGRMEGNKLTGNEDDGRGGGIVELLTGVDPIDKASPTSVGDARRHDEGEDHLGKNGII
jgi:hypothetical protein